MLRGIVERSRRVVGVPSLEHIGDLAACEKADAAVIPPQRRVRQARRATVRGERPPVSNSVSVSMSVRISVSVSTSTSASIQTLRSAPRAERLALISILILITHTNTKRTPS